jgi:hypothetical protein
MCDFLGIEYLSAMLDVGESSEASQISRRSALWENNNKPPIHANIDKFTRELGLAEIEVIETVAGSHMRRYGYELMTEANTHITSEAVEQARRRSTEARQKAWQQLRIRDPHDYQLRRYRAWYLNALRQRLTGDTRPPATTGQSTFTAAPGR